MGTFSLKKLSGKTGPPQFTLMGGVLGFIAKGLEPDALAFQEPKLTAVLAWVGLVLSAYGYWMITEYSWHIRTAWNRTEFLRSKMIFTTEAFFQIVNKKYHGKA
jgi:hypothetical protein